MSLIESLRDEIPQLGVSDYPSANEARPLLGALIKHLDGGAGPAGSQTGPDAEAGTPEELEQQIERLEAEYQDRLASMSSRLATMRQTTVKHETDTDGNASGKPAAGKPRAAKRGES